eukprot:6947968-Lingulodinium_polyedra.AAC.1
MCTCRRPGVRTLFEGVGGNRSRASATTGFRQAIEDASMKREEQHPQHLNVAVEDASVNCMGEGEAYVNVILC